VWNGVAVDEWLIGMPLIHSSLCTGKFSEAEAEFIKASKPKEAVLM